ncbi:MAG: RluA family pseudouridine synthase [Spirochaetales bacterium]|nr:RluA family pseudouridine synthase [Spirochaetales bacterium]
MIKQTLTVELPEGTSERADRYIARKEILTRGQIKARDLHIYDREGGRELKLSLKVKKGDSLFLEWQEEEEHSLEPEKLDLPIIYEDSRVVVINKPRGMVVHPAVGNWTGTVVQGLLYHNKEMAGEFAEEGEGNEPGRPGIVHRLDKDTTGVLVTAKDRDALEELSEQFRERETEKIYLAVIKGAPPSSTGTIEGYMVRDKRDRKKFTLTREERGKWSCTDYVVRERFDKFSLLELRIHTGRTHQIRVHMKSLNKPILGDPIYGRKDNNFPEAPLMLHSWKLTLNLPGEEEPHTFEAPLPEDFEALLNKLRELT